MAAKASNGDGRSGIPWRVIGWGTPIALLIAPLVAMQFTSEVAWTMGDFIFAAMMFGLVGALLELAVGRSSSWAYRGAAGMALASAFLHIWITGAVGIIGSENNPGNLLYLGVVAIAAFGSILALGHPSPMTAAMAVTAVAEVLAPVIAYIYVADPRSDVLRPEVFASGIVFTAMWLVSATLFGKAAREAARERPGS
jgi:hypothetical protein